MRRSRSVSPVGGGRFDRPYSPPSHSTAASPTTPTSRANHLVEASYSSITSSPTDPSTAPTSVASGEPALTSDDGQNHDEWFAKFRGDLDVSNDCHSAVALDDLSNIHIYDAKGNSRTFGSLYAPGNAVGQRQLIIFIRHFYCGACQAFVKALADAIPMNEYFSIPIPTSITIIGCGQPTLIDHYKDRTHCPFPVFADASRQLFKGLGMSLSFKLGGRPVYMRDVSVPDVLFGFARELKSMDGLDRFRGGNMLQIGGEFLIEDGEVVWCHRMKNMRGHTEISVLRRLLGLDE